METKWWYKTIRWFAGFFEDQKGNTSSKRAIAYIVIYMLSDLVKTSLQLKTNISIPILVSYVIIELVALGVIGTEFFLKNGIPGVTTKIETSVSSEDAVTKTTDAT
jgi:hypothetical protein